MQTRYATLDGLRGVAAIWVLVYHGRDWFGVLAPSAGYIALDLFFVLSGFVIEASYGSRLRDGLSPWTFFKIRLIRIYPLYLVGLIPGVIVIAGSLLFRGQVTDFNATVWRSLPFSVFMLPSPLVGDWTSNYYPLNNPAWSLLFELLINVFYGVTFKYWSKRAMIPLIMVAGAFLLYTGDSGDGGWNWQTFDVGLLRVGFSFPLGVLLHRFHAAGYRAPRVPSWLCIAAFSGLLFLPGNHMWFALGIAGFPIVVAFAASANPPGVQARIFGFLAAISLALYSIHLPAMRLIEAILHRLDVHPNPYLVGFGFLAIILPSSYWLDRYFDTPARRYLSRIFLTKSDPRPSSRAERAIAAVGAP
jgi:peptidoglycan/LPS O-acetylase OafA/YrhL